MPAHSTVGHSLTAFAASRIRTSSFSTISANEPESNRPDLAPHGVLCWWPAQDSSELKRGHSTAKAALLLTKETNYELFNVAAPTRTAFTVRPITKPIKPDKHWTQCPFGLRRLSGCQVARPANQRCSLLTDWVGLESVSLSKLEGAPGHLPLTGHGIRPWV